MSKKGGVSRQRFLERRLTIIAAVFLAHLAAGVWLALAPAPMPGMESPEGSAINLSLANLAQTDANSPPPRLSGKTPRHARQSQSSPATPASPTPPDDDPAPPVADPALDDGDGDGTVARPWIIGADEPCDMVSGVEARMQADPAVLKALITLPRDARSVANAVMLWDGAWTLDPSSSAALVALDQGLGRALNGAPQGCLDAQMLGPRLVTLRDAHGATLLAIGSGEWRWSQLSAADLPARWPVK